MTIPSVVFTSARPSAPASRQTRAIATMSVTSGESLARTGTRPATTSATPATTCADDTGSHAKTRPRFATFGHEMFTSTAPTPGSPASRAASSANSSASLPAIETTAVAPASRSHGRSCARNASMPGPCRPIELSIPDGVSAIRGVGRPERGSRRIDFVTTPPSVATS